jgi:hypothetical protein
MNRFEQDKRAAQTTAGWKASETGFIGGKRPAVVGRAGHYRPTTPACSLRKR